MIILYSKPNCSECHKTKAFLKAWNIDFKEINVMEDLKALEHIKALGNASMPVVELENGTSWAGYDFTKLEELTC